MSETIILNGHLDSAAAAKMAHDILERRGAALRVDASAAAFAGTLPLQVLISAKKQWLEDGQDFRTSPLSPEFSQAATELGVDLSLIGAEDGDITEKEEVE